MQIFSQRLKECRKVCKMTQKQVAEYIGVSERAYQHYELDSREPSLENLVLLSKCFKVTSDYLLGISDIHSKD